MTARNVAFVGLGVMGYPMAGHLAKAGHNVTVFNRTKAKSEKWVVEYSGSYAETPAEAAKGCEIICSCVGNDNDILEVVEGEDGIFSGMDDGAILIDHTTASAEIARKLFSVATKQKKYFLDAPVSGGQVGAEKGELTIMVGGDQIAFDTSKPIMNAYGKAITLMGGAGAGQLTKMANQICIAGLIQGLSEGLNFAMRADLDAKLVVDVISQGAAQSWQMENRGQTMIDNKFDFGFAVDWMRKDLKICMNESQKNGAKLPITEIVAKFYDKIALQGGSRLDTSSLIKLLK